MKRNDLILIGVILTIAIAGLLYMKVTRKDGDVVVVMVDGAVYKELPLEENTTIEIEGVGGSTNYLVIEDGHAQVTDASCPDKLCVHQKQIENDGETIVCLPNKVIVEIQGQTESELDSIAN